MKRLLLFMCLCLGIHNINAQSIPLVGYTPSYNPSMEANQSSYSLPSSPSSYRSSGSYNQSNTPKYAIIGAYIIENGSLVRQKIKVDEQNDYGLHRVSVMSVFNKTANMWLDCNVTATKVTSSDGRMIENNFEWKAYHHLLGTIYFNY